MKSLRWPRAIAEATGVIPTLSQFLQSLLLPVIDASIRRRRSFMSES